MSSSAVVTYALTRAVLVGVTHAPTRAIVAGVTYVRTNTCSSGGRHVRTNTCNSGGRHVRINTYNSGGCYVRANTCSNGTNANVTSGLEMRCVKPRERLSDCRTSPAPHKWLMTGNCEQVVYHRLCDV